MIADKRKASALFLLKAKEVNKISQSGLNAIIQDFTTLLDQKVNSLKVEVSRVLEQRGAEEDICAQILYLGCKFHLMDLIQSFCSKSFTQKHLGLL